MHDEVSETENIRKNLAIERMIIEGCEVLLDTSQTFVRQGILHLHHSIRAILVLLHYQTDGLISFEQRELLDALWGSVMYLVIRLFNKKLMMNQELSMSHVLIWPLWVRRG